MPITADYFDNGIFDRDGDVSLAIHCDVPNRQLKHLSIKTNRLTRFGTEWWNYEGARTKGIGGVSAAFSVAVQCFFLYDRVERSEAIMAGTFGFDDGAGGLFVVVEREPLTSGCLSIEDIDAHILRLQADLDRVGAQMKRALAVRDPAAFPQLT